MSPLGFLLQDKLYFDDFQYQIFQKDHRIYRKYIY